MSSKLKWTKEKCHDESLKFIYKKDFKKYSYGSYQSAYRNNWLIDICSHMIVLGNEHKRMIYRIIFPDNVCYVGLTNNFNRRIYEHLNKKGAVFSYINKTKLNPIVEKLTDYIDIDDAKYFEEYWKNKSEKDNYICLNSAKTGGLGCSKLKWTKEECRLEALKYNNRNEFMINNHSAYNSSCKNKWLDEICIHMLSLHKKWTKDECKLEALKYKNRNEFSKFSHNMYSFSKKYKWLDEICSHMIKNRNNYTKYECIQTALLYKSRNEFKKNNHKIWQYSYKHDLLDEICSHMISLRNKWSKEDCEIESQKYKNVTDFSKSNHNMYEYSRKRNWIVEFYNKKK